MKAGWNRWTVAPGLELDVWTSHGATGPKVLITAGVHGDEYEGPSAVVKLAARLSRLEIQGTVVLVPVANPLAFDAGARTTPADGLNLARQFPGDSAGSITQRLAASIFSELLNGSDYLIDLHSGGVEYEFTPLAGFYGEPGDGNASYQAARRCGLPVLWRLPATPGVLSFEAATRGIVAIGHEYLGGGRLSAAGSQAYLEGALSALRNWGLLNDQPPLMPTGSCFTGDWQLSAAEGLFVPLCALQCLVQKDQPVAEIHAIPTGVALITAQRDGTVLALRSKAGIRRGNWAVLVGDPTETA